MDEPRPVILSVCMRCRPAEWSGADDARPGARLAERCADGLGTAKLPFRSLFRTIRCMSQCKRPCVVAFSGAGRFTYLFGDLDPDRDAAAVIEAFQLYLRKPDGFLERPERPRALQAGILGRVPPLDWVHAPVEASRMFPEPDLPERF